MNTEERERYDRAVEKLRVQEVKATSRVNRALNSILWGRIHVDEECGQFPRPDQQEVVRLQTIGRELILKVTEAERFRTKYFRLRKTYLDRQMDLVRLMRDKDELETRVRELTERLENLDHDDDPQDYDDDTDEAGTE